MYIESSAPRINGDKARLISASYSPPGTPQCLEFWYNMYGAGTGTLNVYFMYSPGQLGQPKFTKQGKKSSSAAACFFFTCL